MPLGYWNLSSLFAVAIATGVVVSSSEGPRPAFGCPRECTCTRREAETRVSLPGDGQGGPETDDRGLSAVCIGGYLPEVVDQLPVNLTTLIYYLDYLNETAQKQLDFAHLTKLQQLKLTQNESEIVYATTWQDDADDIFHPLVAMKNISLNMRMWNLPSRLFLTMTRLEKLDLSGTVFLHREMIHDMLKASRISDKPLRTLNLSMSTNPYNMENDGIDMKVLLPLLGNNKNLTTIDLSRNMYVKLWPGVIEYLPNIKEMNLDDNLTPIPEDAQACVALEMLLHQNITTLDLSRESRDCDHVTDDQPPSDYNVLPISSLVETVIFKAVKSLISLCHAFKLACGWYTLPPCDEIPTWDAVTLDDTCVLGIHLPVPRRLQRLAIRAMPFAITDLGVRDRQKLCFSADNQLEEIDLSCARNNFAARKMRFTGTEKIRRLRIRYSGFDNVLKNPHFLSDFPNLESLDFTGTKIGKYIASDSENLIFKSIRKPRELILNDCGLDVIHREEISSLVNLERLELAGNNLSQLNLQIHHMRDLKLVNLASCDISVLSPEMRGEFDHFADTGLSVNLVDNPLSCTCNAVRFVRWIQGTHLRLIGNQTYTCQHPRYGLMGIMRVNVAELEAMCTPTTWWFILIIVGISVSGSFLIAGFIALLVNKRYKIYHQIFLWRHAAEIKESRAKSYDVFVAYNEDDRRDYSWVTDKLRKQLKDVRICTLDECCNLGDYVTDEMVRLIGESRKILLVLSPGFLKSDQCLYMMQVAQCKIDKFGSDTVELMWLEQVPLTQAHPTLLYILDRKKLPHLSWSDTSQAQNYFWKQLKVLLNLEQSRENDTENTEEIEMNYDVSERAPIINC